MIGHLGALLVGVGLLALSYRLGRIVERDKFLRTNAAGVEQYGSFSALERTSWRDAAIRLVQLPLTVVGWLVVVLTLAKSCS